MCNRCVFTIYYLYEINMLFFIFARGMYNHFTDVVTVQFLKRMILRQLVFFLFIFLKFELFNSTSYIFEFIKLSIYYAVRLISLILGIKIKRFPSKIYVYILLGYVFKCYLNFISRKMIIIISRSRKGCMGLSIWKFK